MTIYSLDVLLFQFGRSPLFHPVLTVASWPAYRFLRRQIRWFGLLISLRIFHRLLWSTQSKTLAEVDFFFLNSLAFPMVQLMLALWSLVPLPFLNPTCASRSSSFLYYLSLAWRILSMTLLNMWNEYNCTLIWTFFGITLLLDWNENWPFPVLWPVLSFPNLLAY